jgi:phosphoenolpyruvate carboxylase
VQEPLGRGEINLFEAHQLARLTAKRLGCTEGEARAHRRRLLEAHLIKQESSSRLRERVREALGELHEPDPVESEAAAVTKADELLKADPLDASHLFFEELRMISRALREISPGDVTDDDLSEIMPVVDQITLTLQKIARRKEREQTKRLTIWQCCRKRISAYYAFGGTAATSPPTATWRR